MKFFMQHLQNMCRGLFFAILFFYAESICNEGTLAKSKIIIAGVCRSIESHIPNLIKNVEEVGAYFEDYAVIIYENNSDDNTAQLLSEWAQRNSRVNLICEMLPSDQQSVIRTQRIANARNKVLSQVKQDKYDDFEYLVMADLDFDTRWPIEAIIETIKLPIEWDCISANGIFRDTLMYYDRYAFRNTEFPFGPELLEGEFWGELFPTKTGTWFAFSGDELIPVYSAFGGLAIFKTKVIASFCYTGIVTEDLKNYYEYIISTLSPDNRHLQKYLRSNNMKLETLLTKIPVLFKKNTLSWQEPDTESISCNEHLALYASMAMKGYGRFYINPKMIL